MFWVHASNAARFEQSYREIADRLRIAGRKDPQAKVVKLVYDWLCNKKNTKWLLILDNVDDARFLFEPSPLNREGPGSGEVSRQPLFAYLPQSPSGSILITTRTVEAALKLVEQRDIIKVKPMDEGHAVTLLQKKLGVPGDGNDVAELVGALEFMPLAIVQAAAYISQRAPRCSIQQYLEEFRKSDHKKIRLLKHEAGHLRRDWEAKNSIVVTWHISFEHIRQARPSAADLLSLMSFFDQQSIPETLIRCRDLQENHRKLEGSDMDNEEDREGNTSKSHEDDGFEEDVMTLRSYSFISVNADQITFKMHRLVKLATQAWLVSHTQLERWQRQFVKNLDFEFPIGRYENWAICQSLFPHARSAITQRPDEENSLREWAALLQKAGLYALGRGNLGDAEKMTEEALKVKRDTFGADHPDTLCSMANLASTYGKQGRWIEAEELQVEVMETSKLKLGADYPDTLTSITNLALTYMNQGRWDEAKELQVEVMETCKTKLGADHPYTLTSMDNLALTYMNQGRWGKAETLHVEALETSKTKLGADYPNTLSIMSNLALTYMNQGRWDEAERLQVEAVEICMTTLGADHPDTLTSIANRALTYGKQGRWVEVERLEVEMLETRKTKLGVDHPDTLISMANLATTYRNQGQWDKAEKLELDVLKTRKTKLRVDHPHTLSSMNNLALTYIKQGRWDEAERLQVEAVEICKTTLGADHPDTLTSMNNLALIYMSQSRWDEAERLQVEVMETSKTKLGADHPDTLTSINNLALTYMNQGWWDKAETLHVEVLETSKTKLGAEHPDTLTTMNNLAFTWKSQGRDIKALELMQECVQLRTRILGTSHPDTNSSLAAFNQWKSSSPSLSTDMELAEVETSLEDVCL